MSRVSSGFIRPSSAFMGMPVFESALATKDVPRKEHHEKPWMDRRAYHRRIQKKWIKRFGMACEPCVIQTHYGLFIHPSLMPKFFQHFHNEAEL